MAFKVTVSTWLDFKDKNSTHCRLEEAEVSVTDLQCTSTFVYLRLRVPQVISPCKDEGVLKDFPRELCLFLYSLMAEVDFALLL